MYAYSERPGTLAARKYPDDVAEETKSERLQKLIALQNAISTKRNLTHVGQLHTVLIEGESKRSNKDFKGRNDQNITVIFPKGDGYKKGDYVRVFAERSTQTSLIGNVVEVLQQP